MKFKSTAAPRYVTFGDTRSRAHFCLLPMSFVVINRETNERQNITYWLESIEIEETYVHKRNKYGLLSPFWKSTRVNGLVID